MSKKLFRKGLIPLVLMVSLFTFLLASSRVMAYDPRDSVFNVKDYGARGDGTTNDTTALTNAANAAGGGVLYFPKGTYLCDGLTLQANTTVMGEGLGSVLKSRTGDVNLLNLANGCKVDKMSFDGNKSANPGAPNNTSGGIYAYYVSDYEVTHCYIINTNGPGIHLRFASRGNVTNNNINNCNHGVQIWGGDSAVSDTTAIFDITITGNIVKNVVGGIWGSLGERITIIGNTVENCSDVGIDFEGCTFSTADGNTVKDCINGALAVFYGSKYITMNNNTVYQGSGYGYGFKAFTTEVNNKISLVGNNIYTVNSIGVSTDQGGLSNSLIEGNVISVNGDNTGIRILEGTKNNIINNNVYVATSRGISFEGSCDSIISGNYIETSSDSSSGGAEGGVFLYWRSSSAPCQRNSVYNNIVNGFVTSINDNCWGDHLSYNLIQGNRVNTIYRRTGSDWYGLITGNVSVNNPNTTVTGTTY